MTTTDTLRATAQASLEGLRRARSCDEYGMLSRPAVP